MSKTTDPPDWFAAKNYSYLRDLDAAGWLKTLAYCAFLKRKAEGLCAAATTFEEEWGFLTMEAIPGWVGLPPVQPVDRADQAEMHACSQPVLILEVYLALQLHILATSESMDHHDSEIMDDGRIDRGDA
jgi:hypothetical protein